VLVREPRLLVAILYGILGSPTSGKFLFPVSWLSLPLRLVITLEVGRGRMHDRTKAYENFMTRKAFYSRKKSRHDEPKVCKIHFRLLIFVLN
jgi:hypothetical protein